MRLLGEAGYETPFRRIVPDDVEAIRKAVRAALDGGAVAVISTGGTVIRMPVEEIKRLGRSTQGVIVMRLRGDGEKVSSLALVMESSPVAAEAAQGAELPAD